jgi:hypothetical protein
MKFNYNNVIKNIKKHPFTLLSLSDREKFHTGFIAYAVNNCNGLLKHIFGEIGTNKDLKAYVENNSIDLVIMPNEPNGFDGKNFRQKVEAIAEVKFKSDLHSDQLVRYSSKVNDIPKKLIYLLEPVFFEKEKSGFEGMRINEIVNKVKTEDTLIKLWVEYIKSMNSLVKEFEKQKLNEIKWENFETDLISIKMKGIFERYRYAEFAKRLIGKVKGEWFDKKENNKLFFKIHNTHGNTLLEFFYLIKPTDNNAHVEQYGLQWQSNSLKLYMVSKTGKKNVFRDDKLYKLANHYCERFKYCNLKRNKKDGKFRSFSIFKLNVFDRLDNQVEKFIEFINELESKKTREIIKS